MSDKTEVLTLRVDARTKQWVEHLARVSDRTRSSFLDRVVSAAIQKIVCCDRGPNICDHLWCDTCGTWSKDTGGMDEDTGEAYFSCGHFQGMSRWTGEMMPVDERRPNAFVDPFQVRTFRSFVEGVR